MKKLLLLTFVALFSTSLTFKAQAAQDSCADLITKFFIPEAKTSKYNWVTRPISDVQIDKLAEKLKALGSELKEGSTLHVLSIDDLGENNTLPGIFKQTVRANTTYENKLVMLSSVNTDPKATFQIRAILSNKEIFDYNLYQGTKLPVSISNASVEFVNSLSKLPTAYGVELKKVEISIVHPYYQVGINGHLKGQGQLNLDLINAIEYEEAIELLKVLPKGVEVILKAITPNGFYFETILKL